MALHGVNGAETVDIPNQVEQNIALHRVNGAETEDIPNKWSKI